MEMVQIPREPGPDYPPIFTQAIDRLHGEGRYRVFVDILRNKGAFQNARCFAGHMVEADHRPKRGSIHEDIVEDGIF
jgi:hypothetical protein